MTVEEQWRGWLAALSRADSPAKLIVGYARLHALARSTNARPILDYNDAASAAYQRLTELKIRVGTMDLRIAAIVLANDALLVSRNLVHFRKVPGLKVEDWTA